jgi:5-methylthioadenosine/S-adenosylhomocysteine deaminase
LQAAKAAAARLGVRFQVHVAETRAETEQMLREHGCTPIGYLHRLGVLDADTLLVHAVWVDAADVALIAGSGAHIAHCPESNMKLGSGVAPVPAFLSAGIPVGLGTDGCASNNDLDLWGEMDSAAKLAKVQCLDPTVLDAVAMVRMATLDGARTLGLAETIGSLTPGKRADLILVDIDQPHLTPLYHPASHLVYAARAADVRHVMIDGRWVVRARKLQTIDLEALLPEVKRFCARMRMCHADKTFAKHH